MMRVADYVMEELSRKGIEDAFVITGRGILFLTDALAKNEKLSSLSMHNEQALSYAAYSYAKTRNSYGVALVSTGCASSNCVTGVLNAWQDHVPVVFISGNNPLSENTAYTKLPVRTYGSQEANIIPIVSSITKYSIMLTDADKVAYELEKAFYLANEGIKGPVWIDIPLDVQDKRIEGGALEHFDIPQPAIHAPLKEDVGYIAQSLAESERPVCLIGSGVVSADARNELLKFVGKNNIPVVYSPSAVDVYPASLRLSVGCASSLGGSREANFCVQNADLLIVLGCRMPSMLTGGEYDKFAHCAKKILVDIDENESKKGNIRYDKIILADVKKVLSSLNEQELKSTSAEWVNKCLHWKNTLSLAKKQYEDSDVVDLYNLAGCLSAALKDGSVLITDAGFEELIIPSNTRLNETHTYIHPFMQGTMGFALPAVIGSAIASKCRRSVVAVIGDGSMMMNLQELQTISFNRIPAKIIIVNNDVYAVIRKRQKDLFRTRTIGTDPSNGVNTPDWRKIAECFGLQYMRIENNGGLPSGLEKLMDMEGAVLCEVMATENQPYLHTSIARNAKGAFERRPMEDQAPFLERAVFESEMLPGQNCRSMSWQE